MFKQYLLPFIALLPLSVSADFYSQNDPSWHYQFNRYSNDGGILSVDKATPPHTIDQAILDTMINSLPEGHKANLDHPEYFPSPEPEIIVTQDAEVFVTFYSEGAGYRNTLGYYTYDGDTNRSRPETLQEIKNNGVIVFPNTSLLYSGGDLKMGTSVSLGNLSVGTKVLFFLVSNGWEGRQIGVRSKNDWIFSSWSPLNKEYDASSTKEVPDHKHVALLWKNVGPGNILLMGFEDILRTNYGCDHDFNDVLFSISSTPMEAINDSTEVETGVSGFALAPEERDTDEDGINDAFDMYPEDPERAYINYYPSSTGKATLVFEDMWPHEGDYDMNDLGIEFSIQEVKDAQHKVKDIIFTGNVQSSGADYQNGFSLALNTPASNIISAQMSINGGTQYNITGNIREDGDSAVVQLFDDTEQFLANFTNVYKNKTYVQSDTFELTITLDMTAALMDPPYNPFLTVKKNILDDNNTYTFTEDIEVHLPNYMPTSYAPSSLFGTLDDTSDLNIGRSYMTSDDKPWALLIPTSFANPVEQTNIKDAYLHYQDWVDSHGSKYADWYMHDRLDNNDQIYADPGKIIIHP